jgi:hypothetical protein
MAATGFQKTLKQRFRICSYYLNLTEQIVTVDIRIQGAAPLSFGKHHNAPMFPNEPVIGYEKRTYAELLHFNSQGRDLRFCNDN